MKRIVHSPLPTLALARELRVDGTVLHDGGVVCLQRGQEGAPAGASRATEPHVSAAEHAGFEVVQHAVVDPSGMASSDLLQMFYAADRIAEAG